MLKVIETNVRGSRSLPFSSKVLDIDFTQLATKAMINANPTNCVAICDQQQKLPYVGVKVPQFSFKRLPGADPVLGVEMASTGEVCVCLLSVNNVCVCVCLSVCLCVCVYE